MSTNQRRFCGIWEKERGHGRPWLGLACCLLATTQPSRADERGDPYDALYDVIMTRRAPDGTAHGQDYHAPLIWFQSSYLLSEPTHSKFIDALDRFNTLSEEEIEAYGVLKRALLQRHLWAVFDWATARRNPASPDPEPGKLRSARFRIQRKVARAMRRLALSKEQVLALSSPMKAVVESKIYPQHHNPDDAYQAFLPADLFDEAGPWVCLRRRREGLPAPLHSEFEAWRSTFLVFMRLPEGRRATLDYLDKLNKSREPVVIDERGEMRLHPATPQFPLGTQFALVEQPLLISDQCEPILCPLIYRVELRAYLKFTADDLDELKHRTQAFAQFVLKPAKLLQGKPSLTALGRSESHYSTFIIGDPFENSAPAHRENHVPLQNCTSCHLRPGVFSFASHHRQLQFRQVDRVLPAILKDGRPDDVARSTVEHKKRDSTWGMLEVLWRNAAERDTTTE